MKIQKAASEVFKSLNSGVQIEPFSKRGIRFSKEEAYAVAREVATMRGGQVHFHRNLADLAQVPVHHLQVVQ